MKQNLIIITPDQLRADYLGCYGNDQVRTPNIDAFAAQSVQFENCYCASPLCAPSRISFATSTYVGEHGHRQYWSEISPDVPNIATSLKQEGYRTGMFGKNHLFTYSRLPEVWDKLDEICLGNYDGHPDYQHSFSSFVLEVDHPFNITARLTDELIEFIRESDRPFFGWINYQDPHPAFTCPEPYASMFPPSEVELPESFHGRGSERRPDRNRVWEAHAEMDLCTPAAMRLAIARYMGQIAYLDDSVGRILTALDEKGIAAHTTVLFFSDHGELLGDYHMTHKNPTFYDCLTKIPVLLRIPALHGKPFSFQGLVEEVDLVPTLLDLMEVKIPPTMVGLSLASFLLNGEDGGRETILCEAGGGAPTCKHVIPGYKLVAPHMPTSFGPGAMLRKDKWKLSIYADDRCELYDLASDPHELENLYEESQYREVRTQLTEELCKRLLAVKMRDIGTLEWDYEPFPTDVRFEPLEF